MKNVTKSLSYILKNLTISNIFPADGGHNHKFCPFLIFLFPGMAVTIIHFAHFFNNYKEFDHFYYFIGGCRWGSESQISPIFACMSWCWNWGRGGE